MEIKFMFDTRNLNRTFIAKNIIRVNFHSDADKLQTDCHVMGYLSTTVNIYSIYCTLLYKNRLQLILSPK